MTRNEPSVAFFRDMVRIRAFEDRVGELFLKGGTAGSMLHLSIGEEAAAVGVGAAMQAGDSFTTHHRGHGVFLARGGDPVRMMAEIAGAEAGYCRGKGGSMHIADMGLGHLGANAIVGGGVPHAVGAALSYKTLKQGSVSAAFFGDGALQQGLIYESMNMAALWSLPALFVAINNQWGMGTRIDRASARTDFEVRARAFGLNADRADGADVEDVHARAGALVEAARGGEPGFLIVDCYRFHGHARKDKSPYRTEEEEAEGRKRDPIATQRARLVGGGAATEADCAATERAAEAEMDAAVAFALAAARPEPDSMFADVYAPGQPPPDPVDARIARALAE